MTTEPRRIARKTRGHGVAEQKRHRELKECAGELTQLVRRAAWFRRNADRYEQQRTHSLASLET